MEYVIGAIGGWLLGVVGRAARAAYWRTKYGYMQEQHAALARRAATAFAIGREAGRKERR